MDTLENENKLESGKRSDAASCWASSCGRANLHRGDCLVESEKIESGSIDLILTDLPYGTMKGINQEAYQSPSDFQWDNVIEAAKIYEIANRVLRKNGKMVLFAQQPFTTYLITNQIPNIPHSYNAIWQKDSAGNALACNKAPVSYYEDIAVFSKNHETEENHPLRTYFKKVLNFIGKPKKRIIDEIGQKADHVLRVGSTQFSLCTRETYDQLVKMFDVEKMGGFRVFDDLREVDEKHKKEFPSTFNLWQGESCKSNVIKCKKDTNLHHPTQKPVPLLEDLVRTYTNEGDTVLDLTMGSGSTGVACLNRGRAFVGIELDDGYFEIACKRIDSETRQTTFL